MDMTGHASKFVSDVVTVKQEPTPVNTGIGDLPTEPFGSRSFRGDEQHRIAGQLLEDMTPVEVKTRPGPGGKRLTYIEGWRAIDIANRVFGFNGWSSELRALRINFCKQQPDGKRWSACVSCTVRITLKDGTYHEDRGNGSSENQRGEADALMLAEKEAVTDANKRALKNFGRRLGLSLYCHEHLKHLASIGNKAKSSAAHATSARTAGQPRAACVKPRTTQQAAGRLAGQPCPPTNQAQQSSHIVQPGSGQPQSNLHRGLYEQHKPHAGQAVSSLAVPAGAQPRNNVPTPSHPNVRAAHHSPVEAPKPGNVAVDGAPYTRIASGQGQPSAEMPGSRPLDEKFLNSRPPIPPQTGEAIKTENQVAAVPMHGGDRTTRGRAQPVPFHVSSVPPTENGPSPVLLGPQNTTRGVAESSTGFARASTLANPVPSVQAEGAHVKLEVVDHQRQARFEKIALARQKMEAGNTTSAVRTPGQGGKNHPLTDEGNKPAISPVTPGFVNGDQFGRQIKPVGAKEAASLRDALRCGPPSGSEVQNARGEKRRSATVGLDDSTNSFRCPKLPRPARCISGRYTDAQETTTPQKPITAVARVSDGDLDDLMESYIGDS